MMPFTSPRLRIAATLSLALLATACADKPSARLDTVSVTVAPAANDTTPVAIDMVAVRDKALVEKLAALTAADWFGQREQTLRDHPTTVGVTSWELVPGQKLHTELPNQEPAWAILVFANYATPGPHRLRVPDTRTLTLTAGDKDVELAP
ncbi:hypothetical protein [Azospirillum rugosum]|uniref:Type VI secretion system protein n=1 Tax=Azospirillum rugosum TaxID=416170 RepID=A0ABS4SED8_9PROT|nr:hypothetical protein [Azospirillum rugosum]MBP2290302.1 type VI secretion system protein [Azospirillum rugosum]MDQ0527778.1 type VI secretion system protein [Azospirillum rugosum]